MDVVNYIIDHWMAITGILVGLTGVLVSPLVWLRTMKEKTEGAEIAAIAKNNAVMREEFAEMNKEMSDHRQRIKTLELLVLEKTLNEKRLQDELLTKDQQIKRKDMQITAHIKEVARLTGLLERCQKCTTDEK